MGDYIQIRNVSKSYPGVLALDNLSLSFALGETHAIVGENGAGKSTLIKILSGAIIPDNGEIEVNGSIYSSFTPKESIALGIQVIYQELNQVDNMTVMDNVFMGNVPTKGLLVDQKEMMKQTSEILNSLGVGEISPKATVMSLTAGYQQMVEIAKSMTRNVKVLILDEPTSALSNAESEKLYEVIDKLKKENVAIIFISHRLEEVFRLADKVSVMRDGKLITTKNINETNRSEVINMMVGRDFKEVYSQSKAKVGDIKLEVKNISGDGFHNVSLSVRKGEILGLAGLIGSGRTETMLGIYGATRISGGEVLIDNIKVNIKNPANAIAHKVALLPEDRKTQGLILSLPIKNNIDLPSLLRLSKALVVNQKKDNELVDNGINGLKIKTPSKYQIVVNLSGGNQQKVVVAKWLAAESDILIFDEPTKGIDVASKQEIYTLLCQLAEEGKAIIMISSDIEEILGMSDRICVFYEGTITGELKHRDEFDRNTIMKYASGYSNLVE